MTSRSETMPATVECAACGGPTSAVVPPPELARFAGMLKPVCPSCIARGEREEAERAAREQAQRQEAGRRHRLARVGVPDHLRGYGFADIDRPAGLECALERAGYWAAGKINGLGLRGPVGVGKTRCGIAAANAMCARRQARWYSTPSLFWTLGSDFSDKARTRALEDLSSGCALVLDDVTMARPTEYAAEMLFLAIDARCDGGAPLLVTTNLTLGEIARKWPQPAGELIASRLSLLEWVRVDGVDKRSGGWRADTRS